MNTFGILILVGAIISVAAFITMIVRTDLETEHKLLWAVGMIVTFPLGGIAYLLFRFLSRKNAAPVATFPPKEQLPSQTSTTPETHKSIAAWNVIGLGTGLTLALAIAMIGLFAGDGINYNDPAALARANHFMIMFFVTGSIYAILVIVSTIVSQVRLSRKWALWPAYIFVGAIILAILFPVASGFSYWISHRTY